MLHVINFKNIKYIILNNKQNYKKDTMNNLSNGIKHGILKSTKCKEIVSVTGNLNECY